MANQSSRPEGIPALRRFTVLGPEELKALGTTPISWLVDGLLPEVGVSVIVAAPKVGKSCLARQLAFSLATGFPFLGREVKMGRSLIIATQESVHSVARHLRQLECPDEVLPLIVPSNEVKSKDALDLLDKCLGENPEIKLVVLDMLHDFLRGVTDGNSYTEMTKAMGELRPIAERHSLQILCIHHSSKSKRSAVVDNSLGSSAIAGMVDQIILLDSDAAGNRTLRTAQRDGESVELTRLEWRPDSRSFFVGQTVAEERKEVTAATKQRIISEMLAYIHCNPVRTRPQVFDAMRGDTKMLCTAFQELFDGGFIRRTGAGKKGSPYVYEAVPPPIHEMAA